MFLPACAVLGILGVMSFVILGFKCYKGFTGFKGFECFRGFKGVRGFKCFKGFVEFKGPTPPPSPTPSDASDISSSGISEASHPHRYTNLDGSPWLPPGLPAISEHDSEVEAVTQPRSTWAMSRRRQPAFQSLLNGN